MAGTQIKSFLFTRDFDSLLLRVSFYLALVSYFTLSHLWYISEIDLMVDEPLGQWSSSSKVTENWLSSLFSPSSSSSSSSSSPLNIVCVSGCPDVFDYNNCHLTSLTLNGEWDEVPIDCPYVQKPLFGSLQQFKSLKTLEISYCGGISSDWLCLIPINVTRLKVDSLSTFPTANQLSTLPPYLKYLILRVEYIKNVLECECDWTDETLQSLPRSLYELSIEPRIFLHLTQRMYEYLPKNLHSSTLEYRNLGSNKLVDFLPPLDRLY